jgi:hypothetical protein
LELVPKEEIKYVVVNTGGVLVNGIPMSAQPVMFITDTFTLKKQKEKNIYYLTESQYDNGYYEKENSSVLFLDSSRP